MTLVTHRKFVSFCYREHRKRLWESNSVSFESPSLLQPCAFNSPRRLSAKFGLRFPPLQTQQKSRGHSSDGSWRQFAAAPPFGNVPVVCVGQPTQGPQEPEDRGYNFDPDLNPSLGFCAIELSGGQAQLTFQKSNAVFNTKPLLVHRLGFTRHRQVGFRSSRNKDQPQRSFVTRLSVGPVFNHPVEYKLLSWPLPHPHIVPPADFDPAACFKLPLVLTIDRRQRPRVSEIDLSHTHRRASETAIGRRPQVKDTITRHASENRKPQLVNRLEKRLDCVLRIHDQSLPSLPSMPFDELLDLHHAISNRMGFWRNPTDLQWQSPTPLADALGEQRQSVPQAHSVSAVHIAQLNRLSFRARVITGIENSDTPFSSGRIRRESVLRPKPIQASCAQILQPVIFRNVPPKFLCCAIEGGIKTTVFVTPSRTQRRFDSRC